MQTVIGIIVGLLVLTLLVVLHELGHFIAARRNGVRVLEFAVGFGPHIVAWVVNPDYLKWKKSHKKSANAKTSSSKSAGQKPPRLLKLPRSDWNKPQDTLILALNWLPLGGYCQMDGESDADERKGTFGAASFWGKTKILFAGVAMNWLTAIVVFTVLALTGMPQFIENQFKIDSDSRLSAGSVLVQDVREGSPAESAGFKTGDKIVSINNQIISTASDVIDFNNSHYGETVDYRVEREERLCTADEPTSSQTSPADCNDTKTSELVLSPTLNPKGSDYALGISMSQFGQALAYSTWSAPLVGVGTTVQLTAETYKGIAGMLKNLVSGVAKQFSSDDATREAGREAIGAAGDSVSGPIGIVGVLFPAFTSAGTTNLAFLAALISVSLACMNVLPIPALDGGRWLLIAIARLSGKKLKKETEEKIVSRAFIALLVLFGLICVLDILRLI